MQTSQHQSATGLMSPDAALASLCEQVRPVDSQTVPCLDATARVLAEPIRLDRPSPACDVSAMDGYALRLADLAAGRLPVIGPIQAGSQAQPLPPGVAARIFTGGMVPPGAEAIIPREQVTEFPDHIKFPSTLPVKASQHIRRQGENAAAGDFLAPSGRIITPPLLAGLAACGKHTVHVPRRTKIAIIVTGGEVRPTDAIPEPWELRDSNGPALWALLRSANWLEVTPPRHVPDDAAQIAQAIRHALDQPCDALLLTGGVSAGDFDFVPGVLRDLGATIVFHKLPIRPGKPVLGAIDAGRPILGLPGNPVSALVTARRFAIPALRVRAGITQPAATELVDITDSSRAPATMAWFPLVRLTDPGRAQLVQSQGSGDWVSAAGSDGFIEVPPGQPATGQRPLFRWSIES